MAVALYLIVVGMCGLFLPFMVAFTFIDKAWDTVPRLLAIYSGVVLLGIMARGLARREAWTRIPALVVTALLLIIAAWGVLDGFVGADDQSDGAGYMIMGGFMFGCFAAAVFINLCRSAGPEAFRPCAAGWLDDPLREARLRYWDGNAWTGHVAP